MKNFQKFLSPKAIYFTGIMILPEIYENFRFHAVILEEMKNFQKFYRKFQNL